MSRVPAGSVQYHFRHAIGGFFELPVASAARLLPPGEQPVEPHHGQGVLSVMAFDFHDSMVGPYGELILSVAVPPRLMPGQPLPRAAFFPFLLGTTTRASREHAIERWHLPHFMDDITMSFDAEPHEIRIRASHGGAPIVDLRITDHDWTNVSHRYQAHMHDAGGDYQATIIMDAAFSESEEEAGAMTLYAHAFTRDVDRDGVSDVPFRELWMRHGVQTFHPLERPAAAAG